MMYGDGYGLSRPDLYVTSLIDKLHGWTARANELSETTKLITTLGVYIKKYHGSHYYGKAVNVTRRLVEAYNAVLTAYDLLLKLYPLLCLQMNFFRPVRKLVSKERQGAKVIKRYDDPATPYQAGVNLAKALGGGLLTFEGTQHTAFLQGNKCVDGAGAKYLVDLQLPAADTRCS